MLNSSCRQRRWSLGRTNIQQFWEVVMQQVEGGCHQAEQNYNSLGKLWCSNKDTCHCRHVFHDHCCQLIRMLSFLYLWIVIEMIWTHVEKINAMCIFIFTFVCYLCLGCNLVALFNLWVFGSWFLFFHNCHWCIIHLLLC